MGQEIITLYLTKKYDLAINLSNSIIEEVLNKYDTELERRWRNYLLLLKFEYDVFILYDQTNVLISIYDAKSISQSKILISPYEFQKYYFKQEAGGVEVVTTNLLRGISDKNISEFRNIENVMEEYTLSNQTYEFKFYIWK